MKFIFTYSGSHDYDADMLETGAVTDVAIAAERAGWHAIAFTEHPAPGARWLRNGGHQTLDPFVTLGAVAAVTSRLRLMTYLSVGPYRNPLLLAKTAATVDKLSGGRMVLGVGTGYLQGEFRALGIPFDERNELFDEMLEVLPMHWSGEPFSYEGKHFTAKDIIARPAPVQRPIPIWIGGNSTLTLRRVAERAQGWMPMLGSEQLAKTARSPHIGSLEQLAERIEVLHEMAGDRFADLDLIVSYHDPSVSDFGTDRQRHLEQIEHLRSLGITHLTLGGPHLPAPAAEEFIAAFGETYITGQ